jgi:hypothetical protein
MADKKPDPLQLNNERKFQTPTWTVTRRQRTEVSPKRTNDIPAEIVDPEQYQQRTITSTERTQIVQMPIEIIDNEEADFYLSLSPTASTSQYVESTTTTIEAGGIPVIGAMTHDGQPIYSGIYQNHNHRQTTTIITTTTTTYVMLDDSSETSEEYERLSDDEQTQLTIDMPLIATDTDKSSDEEYVFVQGHNKPPEDAQTAKQTGSIKPGKTQKPEEKERIKSSADTYITSTASSTRDYTTEEDENVLTPTTLTPTSEETFEMVSYTDPPSTDPFKKGAAHQDYPTTEVYEGPIASTSKINDVNGTPLETHVSVYHPGRSDIPVTATTIEPQPFETEDFAEKAAILGSKITGFFKQGAAHQDYPTSKIYEGPVASTSKIHDVNSTPLETLVTVYHSGRSDIPVTATTIEPQPFQTEDFAEKAAILGSKITGFFKQGAAHQDYPPS